MIVSGTDDGSYDRRECMGFNSVPLFMVIGAAWIVTAALWG